jgi:predicted dehydrogenase
MTKKEPLRIALIGAGKIARDQHVPALAASPDFTLVATADPVGGIEGVPAFPSLDALLADGRALDAVSVCTPPRGRGTIVARALAAGLHVMMEKPPATTLSEVAAMEEQARAAGTGLFAAWHSREAGAVAPAKAWLARRRVTGFSIAWKEDIRRWHPGQDWILDAGGFGVFDPGINALSIATAILPQRLTVTHASFEVPANRQSPVTARMRLASGGARGEAVLDFLEAEAPCWDLHVATGDGALRIGEGGGLLEIDGVRERFANAEYARLYARFAAVAQARAIDVDARPSRLVADAFTIASRRQVAAFAW